MVLGWPVKRLILKNCKNLKQEKTVKATIEIESEFKVRVFILYL